MTYRCDSEIQINLYNSYRVTVIEYIIDYIMLEFYNNYRAIDEQWVTEFINKLVVRIETGIYEDIDDFASYLPGQASDLLWMVSERWESDGTFISTMVKQSVHDLLYPVYSFLMNSYQMGVMLDYERIVLLTPTTVEITFKVTSEDVIRDTYKALRHFYN